MKKVLILVLLALITLPIAGQQYRMSIDATFDKSKKYVTFTFKNNCKNLELVFRNGNPDSGTGNYFLITAYDKNNNQIGYSTYSVYFSGKISVTFLPEEVIKTNIDIKDRLKGYVTNPELIYKIKLHCIVYPRTYADDIKERYEKDYTFYWK